MRVLIVEDAPAEAELFADLVALHGHDPIVAGSAEAALDCLTASAPDAVLLDLSLPGMNGVEFLQALAERHQAVPVVAISGVATEDQAKSCLRLGAVEFLPKPLAVNQLEMLLDFLEAGVLTGRFAEELSVPNRRRYPRVKAALDITMEDLAGDRWEGQSVDLSPFGVKVRSVAKLDPGRIVRLSFAMAAGEARISVLSLLVRRDADGQAFAFVNLTSPDFTRLRQFVDSCLPRPA